jgi:hypothetical protein
MRSRWLLVLVLACSATSMLACSSGRDDAAETEDELRRSGDLRRKDAPRGAFRSRAEEIAQEWLDGNIMTGDARLDAGTLEGRLTETALAKFSEKMVTDHLTRQERTYRNVESKALRFEDALLKEVAKVVGVDGFVYDPSNPSNWEEIEAQVRELVTFLGDTSKLDVVKVTAKASDGDAAQKRVTQFVFINRETRLFVAFYAREGTV